MLNSTKRKFQLVEESKILGKNFPAKTPTYYIYPAYSCHA